jgi:hypothetical protein
MAQEFFTVKLAATKNILGPEAVAKSLYFSLDVKFV